jgi:hypothetical protein
LANVDEILPEEEIDAETERIIYRITEGLQRLNSIGVVQFIQINLTPQRENVREEINAAFTNALEYGRYVNQTIVLEQMESGDSFMRTLNSIRKLFQISKTEPIDEIQAVINIEFKGEAMDIIVTYDPAEHDISLVDVSQKEVFFKILELVRFLWLKSRPRI